MVRTLMVAGMAAALLLQCIVAQAAAAFKVVTADKRGTYFAIGNDLAKFVAPAADIDLEVLPTDGSAAASRVRPRHGSTVGSRVRNRGVVRKTPHVECDWRPCGAQTPRFRTGTLAAGPTGRAGPPRPSGRLEHQPASTTVNAAS